jgi:hypothetical protein
LAGWEEDAEEDFAEAGWEEDVGEGFAETDSEEGLGENSGGTAEAELAARILEPEGRIWELWARAEVFGHPLPAEHQWSWT